MTEYLITIYHKGTQIINGNDIVSTPCSIITTNTESIVMELSMKGITDYTIYPPPDCSLTYSGNTIYGLSGEALSFGDVCYFKSDGKFYKTDANSESKTKGLCVLCVETTLEINRNGYFLAIGEVECNEEWNWNTGDQLYISTTPGDITNVKSFVENGMIRLIGYAKSSDSIWFHPDKTYMSLSSIEWLAYDFDAFDDLLNFDYLVTKVFS